MENQDIKKLYFSNNNSSFTYDLVRKDVQRKTNYDINKNKNFKTNYEKMALSIYNNLGNDNRNLVNLNNTLIEKSTQYFIKLINEKKNKSNQSNVNTYMPQPIHKLVQPKHNNNPLPFTLSDEFLNDVETVSQPIYNNMDTLNLNDSKDPMVLMEQERMNREKQFNEFNEQFKKQKQNSLQPSFNEDNNSDFSIGRDDALVNTRVDSVNVDPLDLYRKNEEIENRMINSMTNNHISQSNNQLENSISDSLNKISKDYITNNQPVYLEKEHFISVNSIDRDWTTTSETRYNFKVNFDGDSQYGATISTAYKNVISVELINVYIPQDPIIVPFDNRLYLDALHYPYLLLEIDELDGVFKGSNTALENSFSQLIFDKEHSSQVLSDDYIADADNGVNTNTALAAGKTKFQKQYVRGYYRFIPSFFEKKQYYNAPLSSLKSMSVKLNNPDGDLLNDEIDVLSISAVSFELVGNFEIDASVGLPQTTVSKYIRIRMETYFYNKQFKIGDKIKISGVTHGTTAINDYITRNKGHNIVNLEAESLTGTDNKSFIRDIYIAPPGNMKTDNTTENTVTESGAFTVSSGKLINVSLQTNLLFKVVTREVDVQSVTKPQNI